MKEPSVEEQSCVFCKRIANREYEDRFAGFVCFEPLNPVTPGHKLVVPELHTAHLNNPELNANQVGWALRYFTNDLDCDYNIITSKGTDATQTIQHLHFHIVPRHKDDGLQLPWSTQQAQMRDKVLEYKRRNILRMNSSEIALIDDLLTILGEE
ncbi:MAG: HIT domain-containing protein [Proteobacteria bacterium]|jgi:histidine triad (HIT) family protein|nr:HIT domain-containing protein [Pseudomonadota bacterium]